MIPTRVRRFLSLRSPVVWLALAAAGALALLPFRPPRDEVARPVTVAPAARQTALGGLEGVDLAEERNKALGLRPASAPPPESGAEVAWGRRIIRHATLEVELDDVERAVSRLTDLVEAAGGYVADTQVQSDEKGVLRATVTAYVPPTAFGRALGDLERIGHARARRVTGQDVSEEFIDLEARTRNLERHEAQLLSFMGKAQKVADLVTLEQELARVRGEIERLSGRTRFLRARTEMAGIQVSLFRVTGPVPADGAWVRAWAQVRHAFVAGWQAAFDAAVGLAAVAAQLSPLAVPAAFGWILYRRFRRAAVAPAPPAAV